MDKFLINKLIIVVNFCNKIIKYKIKNAKKYKYKQKIILFEIKFLKRHCYIYVYLYIIYNKVKVKSNRRIERKINNGF